MKVLNLLIMKLDNMEKITHKTPVTISIMISVCAAIWFLSAMNSNIETNTTNISEIKQDVRTLVDRK